MHRRIIAALCSIRRRGSTTAAIAGANASDGTLVVHDANFMCMAKQMGAKRVQTLGAFVYGNPVCGPIVVDHHAVVALASAFEADAEEAKRQAERSATIARQLRDENADLRRQHHAYVRRLWTRIDDMRAELDAFARWGDDGGR